MSVSPAVREAWATNARVNDVLLAHLTPAMLDAQTPGGGYTVARHVAHVISTVQYWGSLRDKARLEALPSPIREYDEATGRVEVETDLARLAEAWPTHLASVRRHVIAHLDGLDVPRMTEAVRQFGAGVDVTCPGGSTGAPA